MLRRKRAWHEPEPRGWSRAIRGLVTVILGVGVPVAVFVWIWGALAPRPAEPPAPPRLGSITVDEPAGALDGVWTLDPDASWVGYRIEEEIPRLADLFEAVGRTDAVEGALVLDDGRVVDAWVEADLRQLQSDNERRDRAIRRRFLESDQYPDARFAIVEPIGLLGEPQPGRPFRLGVTGELTLRDTTRVVRARLLGRWDGDAIRVIAALPVHLADYGIRPPRLPGFRLVEDEGALEVNLTFVPESVTP